MSKPTVDWIAIEGLYRAGQKSLRAIAEECGTAEGTIRSRAKKLGWVQDATGTKRRIVSDRMAGFTQGVTQCVMREIESEAEQDVVDMTLGLKGARAILQCAVDSIGLQGVHETPSGRLELILEPKDQKILSECIRINVDTIRRIRGLDLFGQAIAAAPLTREELDAFKYLS
jgi:DNA-directed RNA polymerase beta' subunit